MTKDVFLHCIGSLNKQEKEIKILKMFLLGISQVALVHFAWLGIVLWFICAIPGNAMYLPLSQTKCDFTHCINKQFTSMQNFNAFHFTSKKRIMFLLKGDSIL